MNTEVTLHLGQTFHRSHVELSVESAKYARQIRVDNEGTVLRIVNCRTLPTAPGCWPDTSPHTALLDTLYSQCHARLFELAQAQHAYESAIWVHGKRMYPENESELCDKVRELTLSICQTIKEVTQ